PWLTPGPHSIHASYFGSATLAQSFSLPLNQIVQPPPLITVQPLGHVPEQGARLNFSVTATGPGPFGYQWRRNGYPIATATKSSFRTQALRPTDTGVYDAQVTGVCATPALSAPFALFVVPTGQTISFSALDGAVAAAKGTATNSTAPKTAGAAGLSATI